MNNHKRGLGIFMIGVVLLSMLLGAVPAMAQETQSKAVFELISFGILPEGTEAEEMVTREKLADMVARTLQLEHVGNTAAYFQDVDVSSVYYDSIGVAAALGIMQGDETGLFRPKDAVSYQEAVKVLVCILGYDAMARSKGGYPMGYLAVGGEIGLLGGGGSTQSFNAQNLYQMFYNALDIPIMVPIIGEGGYEIDKDETLRQQLSNRSDGTLHKGSGIVEANYYYYINQPVASIEEDQVMIEGRLYYVGTTGAANFVGQEVEFYAKEDDNGVFTLISLKAARGTNVMRITDEMFGGMDGTTLYYYAQSGSREKLTIANDFVYLYNQVRQMEAVHNNIDLLSGTLILIDNDGNQTYDVVMREEYETVRVDSVINGRMYFQDNKTVAGQTSLFIDKEDLDKTYLLYDAQGTPMEAEEIQEDMILSVMSNAYGTFFRIIASEKTIEGTVETIRSEEPLELVIDGTVYQAVYGVVPDVDVGDSVKVFLNERGQIADVDIQTGANLYGYVVEVGRAGGMGNWQLKLLEPGTLTMQYDVDDSDPDNVKTTPYLKGRNDGVKILEVATGVSVGGSKYSGELSMLFQNPENRTITYQLNNQGKVSRIDFPERIGSGDKRKYNGYERLFGGFDNGAFATNDNTKVICVPETAVERDEDYRAEVEINNGSQYTISGYEQQSEYIAELVVITMPMKYDNAVEINENQDNLVVVTRVKSIIGENGDSVKEISFLEEGEEKTYRVADTALSVANGMGVGDVFYYTLNPVGEIGKMKLLQKLLPRPALRNEGSMDTSTGKHMLGILHNITYKTVDDINNTFVDRLELWFDETGSETYTVQVNVRNTPPIFVVEAYAKTVREGTREDLATAMSNGYAVYVRASDSKIRGVVLVSYE